MPVLRVDVPMIARHRYGYRNVSRHFEVRDELNNGQRSSTFMIFGASGDLAGRHLLPAIAQLIQAKELPFPLKIVGVASRPWEREQFCRHVREQFRLHSEADAASHDRLIECLDYRTADVADEQQVGHVVSKQEGPLIAYLALPSNLFPSAIKALAASACRGTRIVIEKPFGNNLESARALNRLLHETFAESSVFRIDHFLGMRTVQNLLGLRFANRFFEPLWTRQHVERVELIWDEILALEGRASYYDRAGALRDMIQNHLMQLLCFVGMEPPVSLNERDLRDRKVDVLRAVQCLSPANVATETVRARYSAGRIGSKIIPAYVEENGIDPSRATETFAEVTLHIDNWRWAGVPFLLRSGKALAHNHQEIVVHFKPVPHLAFGKGVPAQPNRLRIQFRPDRIHLHMNVTNPDELFCLHEAALEKELIPQTISAYGQVLLDVLKNDHTLSIRDDEAEESWRIVQPILESWGKGLSPLREYPAGSNGP